MRRRKNRTRGDARSATAKSPRLGQPAAEAAKAPPAANRAKRKTPEPESAPPPTPVLRGGGVEHTVVAAAGVIVNTTSGPRKYLEVGTNCSHLNKIIIVD